MIEAESLGLGEHDPTGRHPQSWTNQTTGPRSYESDPKVPENILSDSQRPDGTQHAQSLSKLPVDRKQTTLRLSDPDVTKLRDINTLPNPIIMESREVPLFDRRSEKSNNAEVEMNGNGAYINIMKVHKRRQSQVEGMAAEESEREPVRKLSPENIHKLTPSPQSLPVRALPQRTSSSKRLQKVLFEDASSTLGIAEHQQQTSKTEGNIQLANGFAEGNLPGNKPPCLQEPALLQVKSTDKLSKSITEMIRPSPAGRSSSTPLAPRSPRSTTDGTARRSSNKGSKPNAVDLDFGGAKQKFDPSLADTGLPSPMPASIPVPPLSIPTYLQLELSSHRPSPLYIHRSITSDFPYESSAVKIERLLNFISLPYYLEGALVYGTLACFDAWLYTFTILPLRLLKSFYILGESWVCNTASEVKFVSGYVYQGTARVWRRRHSRPFSTSEMGLKPTESLDSQTSEQKPSRSIGASHLPPSNFRLAAKFPADENAHIPTRPRRHRRMKSVPSALLPDDKADILKGFLIISTCLILMRLDASRMYHWIRGQAAIKLYVIYNVLEVCDRLFSAIGQDVLECLFSRETLERKPDGHSKILRPFWLFMVALVYTVIHSTALFYQVITLNVAVNSYSNALITLLISNQFVEIKSTVFKKFEKENLFQLTCADVVERFQLWLMLTIIASRNIVETGGLNMGFSALGSSSLSSATTGANEGNPLTQAMPPRSSSSILPRSFELVPALFNSLTAYAPTVGQILGPFLVVLGSEMVVDWLKHAYINKFNNTRPTIYSRFLDVLAKDYYSNAFGDQNLTKRLGLPLIPLSCLFIRAGVQTYHMFVAAWIPSPVPSSATSLTNMHNYYTTSASSVPTSTTVALSQKLDSFLRQLPASVSTSTIYRHFTTILIILLVFLVLLACKLVLGMMLLSFSRSRYRSMKEREKNAVHHVEGGRRLGGWGAVEVDEDKRRWIYDGDTEGAKALKQREERDRVKQEKGTAENAFDKVKRYEMVAKRIW